MTTQTQTNFQPTLMQKLLSRNYKWWYIISYSFKRSNLKFVPFLILNLGSVLDFVITIYLWTLIDSSPARISYFFFGFMFQRMIWSQYMVTFGQEIISGKLNNRLIQPISNFLCWFYSEIGSGVLRNFISAILILLFFPLYSQFLVSPSLIFLISLPLLLVFGFVIDFCFSYLIGCIAFWNEDFRPYGYLFAISIKILSGIAIPFSYMPPWLRPALILNPYALITYHPMQIYLGNYSPLQTFYVFTGGIIWCAVLYFLAKWVFKMGLKRNEAVGL